MFGVVDQGAYQLVVHALGFADEAQINDLLDHAVRVFFRPRGFFDRQQAGVLARQTDAAHIGFGAGARNPAGDFLVDRAGQHHLGDFHRGVVGDAQAVDKG